MRRICGLCVFLVLCVSPLAAETELVLSGRLAAEGGDALAGARISVSPYEPDTDRLERELRGDAVDAAASALSDRAGRFRLQVPSAGLW